MAGSNKMEVETARQLFLYGAGDGKRVIGVKELVKGSGLHENTIRKHIVVWQKEAEKIVANSSRMGLGLHLSAKELHLHEGDMKTLREQMEQLTWELNKYDDLLSELSGLVEKFAGADEMDNALKLFDRYIKGSFNKQNLRTQFLAHQRQWVKLSGVESLMDVALTREKTLATGKAKQDLAAGEVKPDQGIYSRSGVFAKREIEIDT